MSSYQSGIPTYRTLLRRRAIIIYGDFSVVTHANCYLGPIKFFGSKNYWNRILATTDNKDKANISEILDAFLTDYMKIRNVNPRENLDVIINQNNFTESEWQYYFIKYPQILNSGFNLFTWKGNGLDINKVQSAGKQPLNSYHSNPYLIALQNLLDKSSTKAELWYGRYSYDMSCIQIEENFQIYGDQRGFRFISIEDYEFPKHLVEEFNLIKRR